MARERASRSDSNVGLLEERLSEISKNQSMSVKNKMDALEKLVSVAASLGEMETQMELNKIQELDRHEEMSEDVERDKALKRSSANDFISQVMGQQGSPMQQNSPEGQLQGNQIGI
jgi:hypothetical protein